MTKPQIIHPKKVLLYRNRYGRALWYRALQTIEFYEPNRRKPWRTIVLDENQNDIHGALRRALRHEGLQLLPDADFHLEATQ